MPRSPSLVLAVLCVLSFLAPPAAAQFPGEILGRVVNAESGVALEAAAVALPSLGRSTVSDATGLFHLRGLEPGTHPMVVKRLGYADWRGSVEVRNGRTARPSVALKPSFVQIEGVEVTAAVDAGATRIDRHAIARSGARTLGDALQHVPGILVRGQGADRQQTISIRGSGTDAVLVLVDGVPLNDAITGTADLSTVSVQGIESITVLVGAQSARYGPRAEAGVVLIRTREADRGIIARVGVGSLRERAMGGELGGAVGGIALSAGGQLRATEGAFEYERVPGVDRRAMRRTNADLAERSAFITARARLAGGELTARTGVDDLDRGLPGKGYAPSTRARQDLSRSRGSVAWRRSGRGHSTAVSLAGVSQLVRYADPDPPFGLPYDDATRVRSLEMRAEWERPGGRKWLRGHGSGIEIRRQHIESGSLSDRAPRSRTDVGWFVHAAAGREIAGMDAEVRAEARLDHDPVAARWYPNRALTARLNAAPFLVHVANRSGYSPPSLGDQFFREGVAVAPNPELQPERIPSEWEGGATLRYNLFGTDATLAGRIYEGDVRGMIVWLPDFRFVWSPQNTDVRRRGIEVWSELSWADGARLISSYSLAAVTYDRAGEADTVQVAYRPRHTGQLRAEWSPGPWHLGVSTLFTGRRYPAPAPLNPLSSFWTLDLNLSREWRIRDTELTTALHVDRLLNEKQSMIFGFPEAGRRIRLDVQLRRAVQP